MGTLKHTIAVVQRDAAEAKLDMFHRYGAPWPVRLVEKQRLHAALLERVMYWSAEVSKAAGKD